MPEPGTELALALRGVWGTDEERAEHIPAIPTALLQAGRYKTYRDLMRGLGIAESCSWGLIEARLEEAGLDDEAGEIFALLYEPPGLGGDDA